MRDGWLLALLIFWMAIHIGTPIALVLTGHTATAAWFGIGSIGVDTWSKAKALRRAR